MNIARVLHERVARAAVVDEDRVHVLAGEVDVPAPLAADPAARERLAARVSAERSRKRPRASIALSRSKGERDSDAPSPASTMSPGAAELSPLSPISSMAMGSTR